MLFYNADLFRNASVRNPSELYEAKQWTWDAFRDAALRLTKRTGDTAEQLGAELPPSFPWALPFIWTLGGDVFNGEHKQATVTLPKTIDALQRLADLHLRDQSVWVPGGDMGTFLDWERPGKVGMAPSWDARTAIWRTTSYRWDIAPLPRGAGGETTILQIDANGVARDSRVPELAWSFVREWTGKERALPRLLDMGQYPARKSLADPWKGAMAPKAPPANLKYFDALAKAARPVPPVAQWARVAAVWDKHAPQIYLGRVTAREGAEAMTREMNEILAG
jgi:multiple sugar transport system substrate-binding protein